jgi:outer membrane protein
VNLFRHRHPSRHRRRWASFSAAFAIAIAAGLDAQEPPPQLLSLGEALEGALTRNFTIQASRLDPAIALEAVRARQGAFDPILSAEYGYTNVDHPARRGDSEDASLSLGLAGVLPTGTRYFGGLEFSDSTNPFSPYDPDTGQFRAGDQVSSSLALSVTQPLLRGFRSNELASDLLIARRQRDQSDHAFRGTVIDTVTATVRAYHDLYFAERNLAIAERNRANAAQLLADNQRRVDAGAMAPLDIFQAQSEVAVRESAVINARRDHRAAENRLKALVLDRPGDLLQRRFALPALPDPNPVAPDPQADFPTALQLRPDYQEVLALEDIRDTELRREEWASRPQVDLYANVGRYTSARGLSQSWQALDSPGIDRYTVGVVVSHPLFNRSRDAQRAIAHLRRNQTTLTKRHLEQRILLDLDDAATGVIAAWQRVEATREARVLAEKSLEAEEKKLRIGTSSTFVVLRLQGDLASAEIRELAAVVDYFTAIASYESARGTTLEAYGLRLL